MKRVIRSGRMRRNGSNAKFDGYISLAADNLGDLRVSDVYRVMEQAGSKREASSLAKYLVEGKPSLAEEVSECMVDLGFGEMRRNGSNLDTAIKIREDFYDKPHSKKAKQTWKWPNKLREIGTCEAVMYTSNKWQKDGRMIDYKHVKEGPQHVLVRPSIVAQGDADEFFGPTVDLKGDWPDSFAVLADCIGIQAQLYCDHDGDLGDFVDLKFPKSKLGAGKFKDGSTFVFVYDNSGVLAVVIGSDLEVLKDGIVG